MINNAHNNSLIIFYRLNTVNQYSIQNIPLLKMSLLTSNLYCAWTLYSWDVSLLNTSDLTRVINNRKSRDIIKKPAYSSEPLKQC